MRIIRWFAELAVWSILLAPALSIPAEKGCACTPGGCSDEGSSAMKCCSGCSSDFYNAHETACSCQIPLPSNILLAHDPAYSYIQRGSGSIRPYDREGRFAGSLGPNKAITRHVPNSPPDSFGSLGPPDMEVIEFLPPSARLVFNVLASEGPLTQKDLISKTDLPPRTVRYALGRLKEECIIKEGFNFRDGRQSMYGLNIDVFRVSAKR